MEQTTEQLVPIIRANAREIIEDIDQVLHKALFAEFDGGYLSSVYVEEKTDVIRRKLDRLDRMAQEVEKTRRGES